MSVFRNVPSPEEYLDTTETRLSKNLDPVGKFVYNKTGSFLNPEYTQTSERATLYLKLTDVTRELLDLLYSGGVEGTFVNPRRISPLEIPILSYDELIGEEDGVVAIGDRIGLDLVYNRDTTPTMQFYVLISDLITSIPKAYLFSSYDINNDYSTDNPKRQNLVARGQLASLEKVMNMNYPDFEKWMTNIGMEANYHSYRRRLRDYPMYLGYVENA